MQTHCNLFPLINFTSLFGISGLVSIINLFQASVRAPTQHIFATPPRRAGGRFITISQPEIYRQVSTSQIGKSKKWYQGTFVPPHPDNGEDSLPAATAFASLDEGAKTVWLACCWLMRPPAFDDTLPTTILEWVATHSANRAVAGARELPHGPSLPAKPTSTFWEPRTKVPTTVLNRDGENPGSRRK
jgi:hypothetical protein